MASRTVRISENSQKILKELAAQIGKTMQEILDKAIEEYRRKSFLISVNDAYAVLRKDSKAWKNLEKERKEWDTTLSDGLCKERDWTEAGNIVHSPKRRKSHA